ncbi:formate dehydrogenase subunit delta [Pseudorhodoplanes sinuspersici]|uniref:Formate dehydrogenase n=1 Tax=Pseudorhodoplanes sinuspersici TaxID=1235591 RepID=A0A1W6ZQU4_9HYPH|nr:formate dehydrogenase subunit delta [Pseudorhodoplanes sinuspersici]ARP99778.1 formate dehydrogenase [Pseudorhodoplanes sinuspersici]RKE70774.1 formate dehydrogenase delta subunit [Pseudorhodoplanes sinuspersici]
MSLDQPHDKSSEKLVYMANQIGNFFVSQGADEAVAGTAEHIRKFWDPRMRSTIFAHLDKGGAGLEPHVREALVRLKDTAST